jgi:hypothetical protein
MPLTGIEDKPPGAGTNEFASRVNPQHGGNEQIVVVERERIPTAVQLYSIAGTILAAAHTGSAGFFWIVNHVGSTVRIAVRRTNFTSQHNSVLATPSSGRVVLRRITFTGTPSGAQPAACRAVTAQAPSSSWSVRSANTGMTITQGGDGFSYFPVAALTAVGACPPAYEDWNPEDEGQVELAAGEGLACVQADAGTASDTRRFVMNFSVEEFTIPAV